MFKETSCSQATGGLDIEAKRPAPYVPSRSARALAPISLDSASESGKFNSDSVRSSLALVLCILLCRFAVGGQP
jgi:hypothetical protein